MNVINDVVIFIIDSILCFLIFILFYYIVILVCCVGKLVYFVFIKPMINKFKKHIKKLNGENKMSNTQTVYKIEKGDLVGDIKGDNITVILMNGDINGDVNSKEGDVVLIRGDINGDVKANKVICPQQKSDYENYIDKLSSVEKLSKPDKDNKSDKEKTFRQLPPDYVKCADCVYAENYNLEMYKCTKYNGVVVKDSVRICDSFKQKERHICKSCYHFVKGINESYCSKHNLDKLYDSITYCSEYDGIGETTKHKIDCARATNNTGTGARMIDLDELIERMEKRYYEQFRKTGDFSINGVDYDIADIEKLSDEQRSALYEVLKRGCEEFWRK